MIVKILCILALIDVATLIIMKIKRTINKYTKEFYDLLDKESLKDKKGRVNGRS